MPPIFDPQTETKVKTGLDFPSFWGVKFLNDDYTPMDFVIAILKQLFNQSDIEAEEVTMMIHHNGSHVVGSYPKEIAMTKAARGEAEARRQGHPLRLEAVEVN